jgi:hypothetical protein
LDAAWPLPVEVINDQLHLGSAWQMFVYRGIPRTGWLAIHGQFENGETMLLYTSVDASNGQMHGLWGPAARLRLFEQHLLRSFPDTVLRAWGGYYCRHFNNEQNSPMGMRLARLEIHGISRLSHLPGEAPNPVEDDLLWRHRCFATVGDSIASGEPAQ